nr:MAG TPA: hypothetical protein [Caudoviricetes sp.]
MFSIVKGIKKPSLLYPILPKSEVKINVDGRVAKRQV